MINEQINNCFNCIILDFRIINTFEFDGIIWSGEAKDSTGLDEI